MKNFEVLKHELKLILEKAPNGCHSKIAKNVGISPVWSQKIRGGYLDEVKKPTPDIMETVSKMITGYRKEVEKELKRLNG